jgi:hypothetical protein
MVRALPEHPVGSQRGSRDTRVIVRIGYIRCDVYHWTPLASVGRPSMVRACLVLGMLSSDISQLRKQGF